MEYKVKKITEEIDVLEITQQEYNATNDMYRESLLNLGFPINYVKELKVKKIILTDGLHRKEFMLQVNEDAMKGREAQIEARHNYLESLDKKADREQIDMLNEGIKNS